ncbi:hypothetical protein [Clostridium akagii]|uniref:hypothetical protein n=1 Tax=Clostridium akagii TaxID=91623 RepID=UPI0004793315|nr:hypothetical protein [Clostridium akagii]
MKKKLLDYVIILLLCFLVAPVALYFILSSSEFDIYNLYYAKTAYIEMYLKIALVGLLLFILVKLLNKILFRVLTSRPTEKAKLISIEKIDISSLGSSLPGVSNELEEIYTIKFKHNNEIIDITISKENVKNDLSKEDSPYVEYQHINLIKIFNKFLNIKVHTKK